MTLRKREWVPLLERYELCDEVGRKMPEGGREVEMVSAERAGLLAEVLVLIRLRCLRGVSETS